MIKGKTMFCTTCGSQVADGSVFCGECGKPVASTGLTGTQHVGDIAHRPVIPVRMNSSGIPDGVKGWSWGAFLLNWIWAIGNRTWIGLLAIVPYIGFFVAIWLGFKGREMAWKNREWESVEQFQRVQKKWSWWAVCITLFFAVIGILAAIAVPAYQDYVTRARSKAVETVNIAVPAPQLVVRKTSVGLQATMSLLMS